MAKQAVIGEWIKTNIPARLQGAFGAFLLDNYKYSGTSDIAENAELADILSAFNNHVDSVC